MKLKARKAFLKPFIPAYNSRWKNKEMHALPKLLKLFKSKSKVKVGVPKKKFTSTAQSLSQKRHSYRKKRKKCSSQKQLYKNKLFIKLFF